MAGKFSENLRRIMMERSINQVELSKKSGISQPVISRYWNEDERGKLPSLKNLLALARALNCTVDELTGSEGVNIEKQKTYLSRKLQELLEVQKRTQTELADFANIGQGLVADHIRMRAYPKIDLLIKYAKFFRISLFELTGIEEFKKIDLGQELTENEKVFLESYDRLKEDEKALIINMMKKLLNEK